MLSKVLHYRSVKDRDFLKFVNFKDQKEIKRLSVALNGRRVLHINATAVGGGVAEIMQSLVPYLRSLKVGISWYVLVPQKIPKKFFQVTNKLHNALQGSDVVISSDEWNLYHSVNRKIARQIDKLCSDKGYDLVVIHDPQPLFAGVYMKHLVKKIYISHIDTSRANPQIWEKTLKAFGCYERLLFSNNSFVHRSLSGKKVMICPPAIDPLSPKQKIVTPKKARQYLARYGVSRGAPLIAQVSRFDIWKNPIGVVNAFRLIAETYPSAHLMLVGLHEAKDNPEANKVFHDIEAITRDDKFIHMLFDVGMVDSPLKFTVMTQNAADVIIQNSIKEGFGLTVTEAMWKEKPVVGGPASGIKLQIQNGKNGFIAKNHEELAAMVCKLLNNPRLRRRIGKAAKQSVFKRFLMTRLVLDHLRLYKNLIIS